MKIDRKLRCASLLNRWLCMAPSRYLSRFQVVHIYVMALHKCLNYNLSCSRGYSEYIVLWVWRLISLMWVMNQRRRCGDASKLSENSRQAMIVLGALCVFMISESIGLNPWALYQHALFTLYLAWHATYYAISKTRCIFLSSIPALSPP